MKKKEKLMNKKGTRLKEVGEKYRKGIVSLAEAATLAKVSIYRMMEYVEREKIQAPSLTDAEMEEELKRSKHFT
jgi:predicted HTH domain antitoxin